ncbi:MAG: ROK family protein [Candidatus Symbiothrix sp.]|jgi:glucokinase|nr:ROK family protein [Candidatus Symbiothrix sp.]
MDLSYVIGVDMGGTNTAFGVVDRRGDILYRGSIRTSEYATGESYTGALGDAINDLLNSYQIGNCIRGIGMGVPNGNMHNGTIEKAANIPWTRTAGIPLAALLTQKTGFPCKLTNDANAAALGEMTYGAAKGMKDFIVITLGTGVGSGIVSNGQLVVGHDGFAGELGHTTTIRYNGRPCGCGRSGCLETYASATGVARTAREFLELHPERKSLMREIVYRPLTSKDVYEAAQKGDALAIDVFNFTGNLLGEAIAGFIAFSSPKAIILFGGLAHSGKFLTEPLKASIESHVLSIYKGKTEIIISELNDAEAAILGASALAWEA